METVVARNIMRKNVISVRDDMTTQECARFLLENEISGAPVVDQRGKAVGVISLADIVRTQGAQISTKSEAKNVPEFYERTWDELAYIDQVPQMHVETEGLPVREIMNPVVFSVGGDATAVDMAKTMVASRIHRLLVTQDDKMVGLITSLDLLNLIAKLED